ncbi:MAG: GNAT family N-acetyltransferase [Pseudomonadota bacterium]|nr:GNAT family N-acetyltransferase [Pseudomonadota bacterium]
MPIPIFSIRPVEARDAPELARLCGELGYPTTPAAMLARLAQMRAQGDIGVAVAAGNVGLWGWVAIERRLSLVSDEHAEITALVVDGRARECGIGRALVDMAETWARERGLLRVMVRSNAARPASRQFYERLGFVHAKSQHVFDKFLPAVLQA